MKPLFILSFIILNLASQAQHPSTDTTYHLVFADEFNYSNAEKYDSLSKRWNSSWPWNQCSNQYTCDFNGDGSADPLPFDQIAYRTWNFENCSLNNGILTISSKKENYIGKVWNSWVDNKPVETIETFNYTTGMLFSKTNFRYGYFEIRCKLPMPTTPHSTQGLGPNFWMFSKDQDANNYSEIDIFEFAGEASDRINIHTSNVHYQYKTGKDCPTCPADDTTHFSQVKDYGSCDFSTFHTFAIDWQPNGIYFYKDGQQINFTNNHPDKLIPMPLIVDINHPCSNFCSLVSQYTSFPYNFQIDYIRVYQRNE